MVQQHKQVPPEPVKVLHLLRQSIRQHGVPSNWDSLLAEFRGVLAEDESEHEDSDDGEEEP